VLYLNNLFTNQPLLSLLRKELGVGAIGTTRKNTLGILSDILQGKDEKYEWGSTIPRTVGVVFIALWQDNTALIFMTTVHSLNSHEDLKLVNRRRPALNAQNP